jgi:phosphoserine phosphatase RsbU/P
MTIAPDFFDTRTRNWRARLAISSDFMRELSRYSDPLTLYSVFTRRMNQLFPTDKQLTLSRRGVDRPNVRVTRFNGWTDTPNPFTQWDKFPVVSGGLLGDLLYADEPNLLADLALPASDPASEFLAGQRSVLSIPIFDQGSAQTTVVLAREEPDAFRPEQVPELVWMTNLFGRATQSLLLTQRLRSAYELADAELREIADLQHSLLPADVPRLNGLDVAAHYRPANRAGGDYYDFFPQADGRLAVLVADVSGHGTPAAVLMAITHSIAHAAAARPDKPGPFLSYLNAHLSDRYNRHSGSFVTAFAAVFDPHHGQLTYASAGHVPPRLLRADGTLMPLNRVPQLPLGINPPGSLYSEAVIGFAPGDRAVIFTDGVTEAVDRDGELFGLEQLDRVMMLQGGNRAESVLNGVLSAVDGFSGGPVDDRTVVVVRRTSP